LQGCILFPLSIVVSDPDIHASLRDLFASHCSQVRSAPIFMQQLFSIPASRIWIAHCLLLAKFSPFFIKSSYAVAG